MWMRPARKIALAAVLAGACWGCGPAGSGRPPDLIPVKGTVSYKGKPLTKGTIKFEPDGYGRPARGQLQADGSFVLTTAKDGDGVVPGEHRVTITSLEKGLSKDRSLNKYASPNTTPWRAEVDREHTEFTFDLK